MIIKRIALVVWGLSFYFAGASMMAGEWWTALSFAIVGLLAQGVAWA